jgi:hypothetical protein
MPRGMGKDYAPVVALAEDYGDEMDDEEEGETEDETNFNFDDSKLKD